MRCFGKAILLGMTALSGSTAWAQTDAPLPNDAQAERGGLEDIIVTARKTEESLQDAPIAVSVVSSERIRNLGLVSLDDFAKQSTGISFSQAFGRSTDRPVIRGQSNVLAGVQAGVETGAAFFIDGIYYQGDIQGFDPESIERVEIIKGPQSALYGRNTYAGAINYITKDPSAAFSVSGRLRAAEYDEYEVAGSVSGPILGDALGFRAGARYYTYGGQYRNQLTGKKVGQEKSTSAYLTLTANPVDDLKIRLRGSYQKDDDGPLAIFLQGAADNNCRPGFRSPAFRAASPFVPLAPATLGVSNNTNQFYCGTIRPQPNNVRLNTDPLPINATLGTRDGTAFDGIENEQYQFSGIVDWDIAGSGWTLTSLTGYRRNTNLFGTDSDHSDAFAYFAGTAASTLNTEPAFANTNRDEQRDFSQELRLATPEDMPIRALLGAFYYKQKFQSVDITFPSGRAGLPLGTDLSNYSTIEDKAVFGLVEWKPFERFSITGEVRYQEEIKTQIDRGGFSATAPFILAAGVNQARLDQFGCTSALINRAAPPAGTLPGCRVVPKAKFTGTDPRVTVNYTTPGGTLFYAVYATGRKPGGFNGSTGVTATLQSAGSNFVTYEEERSKGVELGTKFQVGNVFRGAFAFFRNDLTNVQLTNAIPNPSGTGAITSIVTATGDARTSGFELELTAAPTEGLTTSIGVTYVDAHFRKGCDVDEFILNSGGLRPNFDTQNPSAAGLALCSIKGRKLPLGSPWIINGSITYESQELGNSGFRLLTNANFSFEDSKYIQVDNLAQTGTTFLVNARLGMRSEKFDLVVFGRNLTDEDSIPLATRWFDLRYGAGTRNLPPAASVTFDGRPAQIETGTPRGFFATLRKGRTFGVEATFRY